MKSSRAARRTPLFDLHRELGARMVEFAGFEMPLQYPPGIVREHNQTRSKASLFDVSHMGQLSLTGQAAAAALETLMPVDIVDLRAGRQRYAFLTNDGGGVIDDVMVANLDTQAPGRELLVIVNAAGRETDLAHLQAHIGTACRVELLEDRALLALQGPSSAAVIAGFASEAARMPFMSVRRLALLGADCLVSRSGYTGEDGFEISLPVSQAQVLARRLLEHADVEPAGLGARDTLRLEAGLCLHGQDLDAGTTPVEASLEWALSRARRPGGARTGGYPGAAVIFEQLEHAAGRRRVSLQPRSRVPVRAGTGLADEVGSKAGIVTSGGFGPTVVEPVAMGYVDSRLAEPGTIVHASVRGHSLPIEIVKTPIVPHRYYRG